MTIDVAIIVTDAPPLITLAAVESLDYLLYSKLPVIIPDAVFHEATSAAGKLGAQEILKWYRAHSDLVRVEPTDIFRDEILLQSALPGRKPARDIGERAALEVIRSYPLTPTARALLLSDDRDTERLLVVEPENNFTHDLGFSSSTGGRWAHPVRRRRHGCGTPGRTSSAATGSVAVP